MKKTVKNIFVQLLSLTLFSTTVLFSSGSYALKEVPREKVVEPSQEKEDSLVAVKMLMEDVVQAVEKKMQSTLASGGTDELAELMRDLMNSELVKTSLNEEQKKVLKDMVISLETSTEKNATPVATSEDVSQMMLEIEGRFSTEKEKKNRLLKKTVSIYRGSGDIMDKILTESGIDIQNYERSNFLSGNYATILNYGSAFLFLAAYMVYASKGMPDKPASVFLGASVVLAILVSMVFAVTFVIRIIDGNNYEIRKYIPQN